MKGYKNRQAKPEEKESKLTLFFFPKHNPPISIKAKNREEAEATLQGLDNAK